MLTMAADASVSSSRSQAAKMTLTWVACGTAIPRISELSARVRLATRFKLVCSTTKLCQPCVSENNLALEQLGPTVTEIQACMDAIRWCGELILDGEDKTGRSNSNGGQGLIG